MARRRAARTPPVSCTRPQGKPRVAVFSIAHLGDAERMFFVSLLLNQVVAWMRGQTGTTSLRAVVYMDEILGYFPPVANPPSKAAAADAAQAGARVRRRRGAGDAEPGGSGLQGTGEHRHVVSRTAADRARQGAHAGWTRRCSQRLDGSQRNRPAVVRSRQARVPAPQRPRRRPGRIPDEVDALVSARTALARSDSPADAPRAAAVESEPNTPAVSAAGPSGGARPKTAPASGSKQAGSTADPAAGPAAVLSYQPVPAARFITVPSSSARLASALATASWASTRSATSSMPRTSIRER